MKKYLLNMLLVVVMLLSAVVHANAQGSVTVNDSTVENSNVPVIGNQMDAFYQHSQFIIEGSQLSVANGQALTSMKFYLKSAFAKDFTNNWVITITEIDTTGLTTSYVDVSGGTEVYEGTINWNGDSTPLITFDVPYVYNGGNLLVDFHYKNSKSAYELKYFFGVARTNASLHKFGSSDPTSGTLANFSPKVTFTYQAPPTCHRPESLAYSNLTATGADFSWMASGMGETSYEYLCLLPGVTPDWSTATSTQNTSCTIASLNPNTNYVFYVRSYCGSADKSYARKIAFKTECGVVTPAELGMIGFETTEGFVTGQLAANLNCWSAAGSLNATGTTYKPSLSSGTSSSFEGSMYLKMTAQRTKSANNDSCYAVLPQMTFPKGIANYHVKLQMRKAGNNTTSATYRDSLAIAVVADTTNIADHQIVGYAVATSNTYAASDISLATCTIPNGYIMLLATAPTWATTNTKFASFYIDNIEIRETKQTATPTDLAVSNITPTTVDLSWTGTNTARVMLATENVKHPEQYTNWAVDTVVTNNPATINVASATDYYAYVQCFGTDTSDISEPGLYFQSGCDPVTELPWTENFNDLETDENFAMPCWTNIHSEGTATNVAKTDGSYKGDNRSVKIKFTYASDSGNAITLTLPPFDIPTANTHEFVLSYWRMKDSYPELVNEGIYVITDNASAGRDTLFIPRNTSNPGGVGTESAEGWYRYSVLLPKAGVNTIQIRQLTEGSGMSEYIDDLMVRVAPSCKKVKQVASVDIQPRQATIAWPSTGAAKYQVVLATEKINPDTLATVPDSLIFYNDSILTDTAVVTGLTPHTDFYTYVRGLCGTELGEWSSCLIFTTPCEDMTITATDIYFEGFEGLQGGVRNVPCFKYITTNDENTIVVADDDDDDVIPHSGSKLFTYGNYNDFTGSYAPYNAGNDTSIIILPQTTNNVQDLRLKFWFTNTCSDDMVIDRKDAPMYFDTLVAGVITDITDATTFIPFAKFHADSVGVYQLADATFEEFIGTQGRLAIKRIPVAYHSRFTQYWGSNIDDITIELAPTCRKVKHVAAVATDNSVKLTWRAANSVDYIVILADSVIDANVIDSAALAHMIYSTSTTADSIVITNLDPATTYYAYVIGNCGGGDTAMASDVCKFTTALRTPYFQDFQSAEYPTEIEQYTYSGHIDEVIAGTGKATQTFSHSYPDWQLATNLGTDTSTMKIELYANNQTRLLATLPMVLNAKDSLKLTFDVCKRAANSTAAAVDENNEYDIFYVMLADADMTQYTVLSTWKNDESGDYSLRNDIGQWFANQSIDLSDYNGIYRIVFAAGSEGSMDDYDLHLDNVKVYGESEVVAMANYAERGTVTGSCTTYIGAEVTLIATVNEGYNFYGWSNGEKNDTITYVASAPHDTIIAYFVTDSVDFVITINDSTMGAVTGSGRYAAGDTVTVSAIANQGFEFIRWSDGNENAVRNIIAIDNVNLVATFDTAIYDFMVISSNATMGMIAMYEEGFDTIIADTIAGASIYLTEISATAVPNAGYEFVAWSNGATTPTITIVLTSDTVLVATFKATPTAVENVETAEIIAYTEGSRINVVGAENRTLAIYDATGRMIYIIEKANHDEHFYVAVPGVYFIKAAGLKPTSIVVK